MFCDVAYVRCLDHFCCFLVTSREVASRQMAQLPLVLLIILLEGTFHEWVLVVVIRTGSWALQNKQMLHHLPGHERCDFGLCLVVKTSDNVFFTRVLVNAVQRREAFCTASHRSLWCTWSNFYLSGEQWYQLWDQAPLYPVEICHSNKGVFGTVTKGKFQPGSTCKPKMEMTPILGKLCCPSWQKLGIKKNQQNPPRIQELQQLPRSCASLLQTSAGWWGCQLHTFSWRSHCHQGSPTPILVQHHHHQGPKVLFL